MTFSVLGVDTQTGEVGASGASCLKGELDISEIYAATPGVGVLVTQSYFERRVRNHAAQLLAEHSKLPQPTTRVINAASTRVQQPIARSFEWNRARARH